MQCERCNKKKVTVFYRESINGRTRAYRLCGDCAASMQQTLELEELSSALTCFSPSIRDDGITGPWISLSLSHLHEAAALTCPLCGITGEEVTRSGRMGCATCYQTFGAQLPRQSRGEAFEGHPPRRWRARQELEANLRLWRQQLEEAIAAERYEDAAALRDRIREATCSMGEENR